MKTWEDIRMKKGFVGIMAFALGALAGGAAAAYVTGKNVEEKSKKVDKFKGYYNMQNQWLQLKLEGKSLESFFLDKGYQTVAIYGMGEMGNRLYEELKGSQVQVKYGIDKNASGTYADIDVFTLDDDLEAVDVVVVTAVFDFCKIEEEISGLFTCPIISLDEVVFGVL